MGKSVAAELAEQEKQDSKKRTEQARAKHAEELAQRRREDAYLLEHELARDKAVSKASRAVEHAALREGLDLLREKGVLEFTGSLPGVGSAVTLKLGPLPAPVREAAHVTAPPPPEEPALDRQDCPCGAGFDARTAGVCWDCGRTIDDRAQAREPAKEA